MMAFSATGFLLELSGSPISTVMANLNSKDSGFLASAEMDWKAESTKRVAEAASAKAAAKRTSEADTAKADAKRAKKA